MADLILPSASAQTETVVAFVETEPGQRSVRGALSISMFLPGVIKSAVGRLRDGGLGGPILAQHSFTDRGDSKGGNQETWQFEGQFPVTGDALVLTIQSGNSNSPDIFGGGACLGCESPR